MIMLSFKAFLTEAISDWLKQQEKETYLQYKKVVEDYFKNIRLPGYNQNTRQSLINFFIYNFMRMPDAEPQHISNQIQEIWGHHADLFLAKANNAQFQEKLRQENFTFKELEEENARYHRELQTSGKNYNKGPEGLTVIEVENALKELGTSLIRDKISNEKEANTWLPGVWRGWKWVSLGRGYCSEEGAAGGHCGNINVENGDIIFSLRNERDRVHLTFIVNSGIIGEAKGVANSKPEKHYHPAIYALVMSKYIKGYKGGGYLTENDWKLNDMIPEVASRIRNHWGRIDPHVHPENYITNEELESITDNEFHEFTPSKKILVVLRTLEVFNTDNNIELNFNIDHAIQSIMSIPMKSSTHYTIFKQMTLSKHMIGLDSIIKVYYKITEGKLNIPQKLRILEVSADYLNADLDHQFNQVLEENTKNYIEDIIDAGRFKDLSENIDALRWYMKRRVNNKKTDIVEYSSTRYSEGVPVVISFIIHSSINSALKEIYSDRIKLWIGSLESNIDSLNLADEEKSKALEMKSEEWEKRILGFLKTELNKNYNDFITSLTSSKMPGNPEIFISYNSNNKINASYQFLTLYKLFDTWEKDIVQAWMSNCKTKIEEFLKIDLTKFIAKRI